MAIFSLKSRKHWALWTVLLGLSLFLADRTIDFNNLGVVRCSPGTYLFPFNSSHSATACADKGLLDDVVTNSLPLTLLFWMFLAGVVLAGAKVMWRRSADKSAR